MLGLREIWPPWQTNSDRNGAGIPTDLATTSKYSGKSYARVIHIQPSCSVTNNTYQLCLDWCWGGNAAHGQVWILQSLSQSVVSNVVVWYWMMMMVPKPCTQCTTVGTTKHDPWAVLLHFLLSKCSAASDHCAYWRVVDWVDVLTEHGIVSQSAKRLVNNTKWNVIVMAWLWLLWDIVVHCIRLLASQEMKVIGAQIPSGNAAQSS